MENLKSLSSYKSSNDLLKWVFVTLVTLIFLFGGFVYYLFVTQGNLGYKTVYIIDSSTGSAFQGKQTDITMNPERVHEYKNHVHMFFSKFYTYDQFSFRKNIEDALYLVGDCGKQMRNDLIEAETQRKLTANNINMTVEMDSISIDMSTLPIKGMAIATHVMKRPSAEVSYRTWSTFEIHDLVSRSEKNPHGVLIENFKIVKKETIE